ncbi:MAG: isochorismate synthase [Polyangiaceae bacterium]|nr:isochorismate synthase [Polyangiaceae bacterium]
MSLRARVEAAVRRAARSRTSADLVAISVPLTFDAASTAAREDAAFVWDARRAEALSADVCVAFGEAAAVEGIGDGRIAQARAAATQLWEHVELTAGADPRMFGAISFDTSLGPFEQFAQARFALPRVTLRGGSRSEIGLVLSREELAHPAAIAEEVEALSQAPARGVHRPRGRVLRDGRTMFERAVERALLSIEAGELSKVVLARAVSIDSDATSSGVLAELEEAAGAVRYCIRRGSAAFLGATPELLIKVQDGEVRTEAVAGTEPRRGQELAEAARLLSRPKDLEEHRWVVEAITAGLERAGVTAAHEAARVRTLPFVHHLVTPIVARRPEGAHVLDLVSALHPTPALGGSPRDQALAFIRDAEPVPRGLYAGPVGWVDARGNGEMVVALRGALMEPSGALAYAGAGIVRGSVVELEAQETDAKLLSMFRALGVTAASKVERPHLREAGA